MENRPERPVAVRPRRLRPLVLVLGIAAIGLCAGYLLLRGGEEAFYTESVPVSAQQTDASPSFTDGTAPAAAAVIVDAAPEPGATPFSSSETEPANSAAAVDAPGDAVAAALAAAAASPVANAKPVPAVATATSGASARKRTAAATSAVASTPRAVGGKDSDLLATLLKNIERDDPVATRTAAQRGDQSAMDELVQKIQSQNGGSAQRSPDVQALLRQCPRANTTKGLVCRQKVCARFAGLDPACPAQ
ncbi:hypothetical protein ACFOLC_12740 [Lysobacter cavernae]|uniref:Uncharacterized protein n=1 Tax=Lysobacter cavernae TaxID=1685901 RepID=A0ABV7RV68_9GAMM